MTKWKLLQLHGEPLCFGANLGPEFMDEALEVELDVKMS